MPEPHDPYAVSPQGPPPAPSLPSANPYGAGTAYTGSKAYVEQHFGRVAGFGSRAAALIIDMLVSLIGVVPSIVGAVMLVIGAPDVDAFGDAVPGTTDVGLMVVGAVMVFVGVITSWAIQLWNRVFRMGRTGQSVGKQVMGLRLVNTHTGQPIGALPSFARELLSGVINQVLFLSYLWMLWDDNQQTLADKVMNSTVIEVPKG